MDNSSGAPPEVETVHTPAAASALNLAVELGRAWLSDEVLWPRNELTRSGNLRSYSVTCDLPDDTGNQECVRESLGDVNPLSLPGPANAAALQGSVPLFVEQPLPPGTAGSPRTAPNS